MSKIASGFTVDKPNGRTAWSQPTTASIGNHAEHKSNNNGGASLQQNAIPFNNAMHEIQGRLFWITCCCCCCCCRRVHQTIAKPMSSAWLTATGKRMSSKLQGGMLDMQIFFLTGGSAHMGIVVTIIAAMYRTGPWSPAAIAYLALFWCAWL